MVILDFGDQSIDEKNHKSSAHNKKPHTQYYLTLHLSSPCDIIHKKSLTGYAPKVLNTISSSS